MRSLALIPAILLATWVNQSLVAQPHVSWKQVRLAAGMDTVGRLSDRKNMALRCVYGRPLPHTVPVVITYAMVDTEAGPVYYQDIYNALANKVVTFNP